VKLSASVIQSQFKGFDSTSPIVDDWLLPRTPAKAFASGKIQPVDLLIGLNGRELSAFRVDAAAMAKQAGQTAKPAQSKDGGSGGGPADAVKGLANAIRPLYGAWTNPAIGVYMAKVLIHRDAARDAAMDQATNDMMLACPVGAISTLVNAGGRRAFVYRFDRAVPGKGESELGAFHGLEVPYVFDAFGDRGWRWLPFVEADHRLSGVIESYWTNFAKTGDPNAAGLPMWSAWPGGEEPFMDFSASGDAVPEHDFSPMFCHLSPERLKGQLAGN
jgi:para-nitrobenzyl esterase